MRITGYSLCVFLLLSTTGCFYYDYATNKNNPKLIYGSVYKNYDDNGDYEFTSYLYKMKDENIFIEITLSHLKKEFNKNKNEYVSRLIIKSIGSDKEIRIDIKSLKLMHYTNNVKLNCIDDRFNYHYRKSNDEVIDFSEMPSTIVMNPENKWSGLHHVKTYLMDKKPKTIAEKVYIELIIDGKEHIIDFDFELKYKYHYSTFDVMMGV